MLLQTQKCDVFAFGCVLYFSLSGLHPWIEQCELLGIAGFESVKQAGGLPALHELTLLELCLRVEGITNKALLAFNQLIRKCTAFRTEDRPSIEQVLTELNVIKTPGNEAKDPIIPNTGGFTDDAWANLSLANSSFAIPWKEPVEKVPPANICAIWNP